ncbi:MAG: O-antigen ligase family protein [Candidatus Sumerlaeaceae bacterium]|nr:O-antigen ligase family protein [Candidatus Sumerlaeaceae bacterium]
MRPWWALVAFFVTLPLLPILPFRLGVTNFSLSELAFLGVAAGAGLARIWVRPIKLPWTPASGLLALFVLVALASLVSGLARRLDLTHPLAYGVLADRMSEVFVSRMDRPDHMIRVAVSFVEAVAVFHAMLFLRGRPRAARLAMLLLVVAGVGVAAYAVIQFVFGIHLIDFWKNPYETRRRASGTFPDVNSCGVFLAGCLFLSLALLLGARTRPARVGLAGAAVLMAAGVYATFSRTALIALVPAAILFGVANRERASRWFLSLWRMRLALSLVTVLILALAAGAAVRLRPDSRVWDKWCRQENRLNDILKGRLNIWRGGLLLWREHPVTGVGIGSFPRQLPRYHDPSFRAWNPPSENAHNFYLQVAAELGLAGLIPYVLGLAAVLLLLLGRQGSAVPADAWLVRGAWCACLIVALSNLTGHPVIVIEMLYYVMGLPAVALALEGRSPEPVAADGSREAGRVLLLAAAVLVVALYGWRTVRETRGVLRLPMVRGAHEIEREPGGGQFRWTARRMTVRGPVAGDRVGFVAENPFAGFSPLTARIYLDGRRVGTEIFDTTAPKTLVYERSAGATGDFTLVVDLSGTFNPRKTAGRGDERDLGLRILKSNFNLLTRE